MLAITGCLRSIQAADNAQSLLYQYWVDNDFGSRVTVPVSEFNKTFTIPEEYFNTLPNGEHTLYLRARGANGNWGLISSHTFYFYEPAAKVDSSYTALKAYRYVINDGTVRTANISPTHYVSETLKINKPSAESIPIDYNAGNTHFIQDSEDPDKMKMRRTIFHSVLAQFQNEQGEWSNLSRTVTDDSQTLSKSVMTIEVGNKLTITEKPIGGTFEAVRFELPSDGDYSIRTSEGCEVTILKSDFTNLHKNITPSQMVESHRAYYSAGTYYAIIYNSLKNMSNPSDGLDFTLQSICERPQISYDTQTFEVNIETQTEDATIYYTTDGTNPTERSAIYNGTFKAPHNGWIKAVAAKSGYGISYIDSIQVTGMVTAKPTATFEHPKLTLTCETPNATIYYGIGTMLESEFKRYTAPVTLKDNTTVYYKASAPDFDDSEIYQFTPTTFVCDNPAFEYNGKYLKMTSNSGANIYYNTAAEGEWTMITSGDSIEINDTITIQAYAERDRLGKSQTMEYKVPAIFTEGKYAIIREAGQLATALKWSNQDGNALETLIVKGNVNAADLATIKQQAQLVQLDLSAAVVEEETLPDEAFAGMNNLLSFVSPANLTSAGERLLDGCNSLGGIDWRSSCAVPTSIVGGKEYANLILFVDTEGQADKSICKNIVVNGIIDNITLVDAEERAGFFALRDFEVTVTMSYTRSFTQPTLLTGESQGWEAICLPFQPTSFTHETQGACVPIYSWSETSREKPFWLCRYIWGGFQQVLFDDYCSPMIISMPNNDQYADEYILGGNMTFSTSGTIYKTILYSNTNYGYRFVSNFTNKPADESRSVINSYEEYNGHKMGSVFVPGLRGARAFEPYFEDITTNASNAAPSRGPLVSVDNPNTGIERIPARMTENDVYCENGIIYINSSAERDVKIFNAGGQLVRNVHLAPGVNEVNGLAKGVYLINKIKVINR